MILLKQEKSCRFNEKTAKDKAANAAQDKAAKDKASAAGTKAQPAKAPPSCKAQPAGKTDPECPPAQQKAKGTPKGKAAESPPTGSPNFTKASLAVNTATADIEIANNLTPDHRRSLWMQYLRSHQDGKAGGREQKSVGT